MKIKTGLFILLAAASLFSCKEKKPQGNVFKGYVVYEQDYHVFTDCNTGKEYWIDDKTNTVAEKYKKFAKQPFQSIFFSVEADLMPPSTVGPSSTYVNSIVIKDVIELAETSPDSSCKSSDKSTSFYCMGNKPKAWSLEFFTTYIKYTGTSPDTVAIFPLKDPVFGDEEGRRLIYNIDNENFQHMNLVINESVCKDSTGATNRFSSELEVMGQKFTGCAKKIIPREK